MHTLGKGFGKTVSKGLEQDAVVVVVVGFKFLDLVFNADTGSDGKGTNIVFHT